MTNQELQDSFDLWMDKAGAPWFNIDEKDALLNDAYTEFVEQQYDRFEYDERAREYLLPLVRKSTPQTATRTFNIDLVTNFMYTVNVDVSLVDPFNSNDIIQPWLPPRKWDKFSRNNINSFNKPTDFYPVYTEYFNGTNRVIEVSSDTVPISISLVYLAQFTPINTTSSPSASPVVPSQTHRIIRNIAVRMALENIESPRLNTIMQEIQQEV